MNNILLISFCIFNAVGVVLYSWLSIILMEIVLCKDMKQGNASRLFSKSITLRLKLFRRSLGNNFYFASLLLWVGCYIVIFIRLTELTGGVIPAIDSPRSIASMFIPYGIILLYKGMGYQSRLFTLK